MWCVAILLPTPREPECRNSQTAPVSSTVTSMKWLPEPSVPSCSAQLPAYRAGSNPACSAALASVSTRRPAVARQRGVVARRPTAGPRARSPRAAATRSGRQLVAVVLGAHGHHAAADVDADRGRNDRAEGRDHRADRRALAQVRVGHQRDVREDERQRRGRLGLREGGGLDDAGPVHEPVVDTVHRPTPPQARKPCHGYRAARAGRRP